MRVVITGATGNVGTSLVLRLSADPEVSEIVGIARRVPAWSVPKVTWRAADVVDADLTAHFAGADAVVHLAWAIQPSRQPSVLRAINVDGSQRVFEAVIAAGVPTLVSASSIGAYAPGPKQPPVTEEWPATGIEGSFYSRHKAETERQLDVLEAAAPGIRVVRLRPGLIFKREAATGVRRLFLGPFLPPLRPWLVPLLPVPSDLRLQAVHTEDVAEAYRLALHRDVRGAFNIAAAPILGPTELGELLGARTVPVPWAVLEAAATATWRARLQPSPAGWVRMAQHVPMMDTARARTELGWRASWSAGDALLDLLDGLRRRSGFRTPPLDPRTTAPARLPELQTGVGARP